MKDFSHKRNNSGKIHEMNLGIMSEYKTNRPDFYSINDKKEFFDDPKVREFFIKQAKVSSKKDCIKIIKEQIAKIEDKNIDSETNLENNLLNYKSKKMLILRSVIINLYNSIDRSDQVQEEFTTNFCQNNDVEEINFRELTDSNRHNVLHSFLRKLANYLGKWFKT